MESPRFEQVPTAVVHTFHAMRMLSIQVVLAGMAASAGCQGGEVLQGLGRLELISASAEGVSGSFSGDGRVVYFEARRGAEKPTAYLSPGSSKYLIDLRFMDIDGRVFYRQRGGDRYIDSSWALSDEDMTPGNPALRSKDFETALLASDAIQASSQFATELADEKLALSSASAGLFQMVNANRVAVAAPENASVHGRRAESNAYLIYYVHRVEVHHQPLMGGPIFEHSAIHFASQCHYSDGSWYWCYSEDTCNHGDCASFRTMPQKCSWTSGERYNIQACSEIKEHNTGGNLTPSGSCLSQYAAIAGCDYTTGTCFHNCNGDSYHDYDEVRNYRCDSQGLRFGDICSTPLYYAPDCY